VYEPHEAWFVLNDDQPSTHRLNLSSSKKVVFVQSSSPWFRAERVYQLRFGHWPAGKSDPGKGAFGDRRALPSPTLYSPQYPLICLVDRNIGETFQSSDETFFKYLIAKFVQLQRRAEKPKASSNQVYFNFNQKTYIFPAELAIFSCT